MDKQLNIKYTLIQIFYYASICAMFGYASVFLLSKNFSNSEIGMILALGNTLAVVAQPLIAVVADKSTSSKMNLMLRMMIGIQIVLSLLIYFVPLPNIVLIIAMTFILAICMTLMPFMNSLAFVYDRHGYKINFGLARGLGSVAYAVASIILGNLVAMVNASVIPISYIVINVALYIGVQSYSIKGLNEATVDLEEKHQEKVENTNFFAQHKLFMIFLIGVVAIYFTHMFINNFFIQIVNNVGGNSGHMGNAIFLAAMVELPIMAYYKKINSKFSNGFLIKFSLFFFVVKHFLTYIAKNMFVIYIAQASQVLAYAIFIPASVYYVNEVMDKKDQNKGQSLITTSMAMAGIFASLAGGVLLDLIGVKETLLVGVIISAIGFVIGMFTVKDVK